MLVYLAADLIRATKIKSTADALQVPCRPVRSVQMLEDRLGDSDVRAALLDLQADAIWDMLNRLRTPDTSPAALDVRVLCFGPHVDIAAMDRARQGGATEVLPRGAFERQLPDLLVKLSGEG